LPQNALIGILPLFTDLTKKSSPFLDNTCHARLTVVDGPCLGTARYFLDIPLLPKKEKMANFKINWKQTL
jgi:hypothetical protein